MLNKEADKILKERFRTGQLIALATSIDNRPYVRAVNAYYEDGVFYVMTDASSGKMKQIEMNPEVAICGQLLNGRGVAENIGHVLKPEHEELMETLRVALAEWYSYGKVNEADPNTVILKIQLTQATVIDNGNKYELI
jgi:general stress protein 26